jgi:hypothetical protein
MFGVVGWVESCVETRNEESGMKQWEEGANNEMQEERELPSDKLKRLRRKNQVRKVSKRQHGSVGPAKGFTQLFLPLAGPI